MGATPEPGTAGDDLAQTTGHVFASPELLEEALTHPSALAQPPSRGRRRHGTPSAQGYERLEFLGDRVLGLVVADLLWRRYPTEPEGDLTRRHAQLVRREALARVAAEIGLGRHVILARSDAAAGTARSPRVLADVCEAVIAAIYLDGGYAAAFAAIERLWAKLIAEIDVPPEDPKTSLQAWAERRGLGLPIYRVVAISGPDHARRFTVAARVAPSQEEASGTASSKRAAEAAAAAALLERLVGHG